MVFLSMSADRLIPVIGEAMKQAGSWREYGGHRVVNIGPISRTSSLFIVLGAIQKTPVTGEHCYCICVKYGMFNSD